MSSSAFADEQPSMSELRSQTLFSPQSGENSVSSSAKVDEQSQSNTTYTPIDVIYDNSPTLYCSTREVENFTVNQETKEGSFQAQGYYSVQEDQLPVNLQFFLYEGEKPTHYKVEVNKKVHVADIEQEGFEDDEYPGCRIVLFPEYVFQVFFKVLEITPVTQKITTTTETTSFTQETSKDDSDDLVTKILRDMENQ